MKAVGKKGIALAVTFIMFFSMLQVNVFAVVSPSQVWVNAAYTDGSCDEHTWNVDAFSTIKDGIAAVAPGGTLSISAGTYEEDYFEVTKSIDIIGANYIDAQGNYITETIVKLETTGSTVAYIHDCENVNISWITFDRNATAGIAVLFYGSYDFVDSSVRNCKVQGLPGPVGSNQFMAIEALNSANNITFKDNIIEGILAGTYAAGVGALWGCEGIIIEGNDVDGQGIAGEGIAGIAACDVTISDNEVTGCDNGIYENQSNLTITRNNIHGNNVGVQCGAWTMSLHNNLIYDNTINLSCGYADEERVDAASNYWGLFEETAILAKIDGNTSVSPWLVDVNFNLNGALGIAPVRQFLNRNEKAAIPTNPICSGYYFDGWYQNAACTGSAWNFTTMDVTNSLTLYAKWTLENFEPYFPAATVIVNGETQTAGTSSSSTVGGQTVTTITVDTAKLEKILHETGMNATVIIPVPTDSDVAVGVLTGQMIKNMESMEATLEIKTNSTTYTLPASQINIDAISSQLGQSVTLSDIKVEVRIAEPSADTVKIVENAAISGEFSIVVPAVDFTIRCTYEDQTVEVNTFNAYVERMIAIPDGVDPTKITTGIVVDPDGTTHHVPTKVIIVDGKYYAVINSLTNSTYTVVWHPVVFADVSVHWARDAVNDMGSRMIVNGVENNNYNPDGELTRAEFAAIIVRALGLEPKRGDSLFSDVTISHWACGYIETAFSYGIINGYEDGTFGPNDKITREQVITMINRAMKYTGMESSISSSEISTVLAGYADASTVSDYAKKSVAICLKTGIVIGRGSIVAPKDHITRAEAAVIVQRLLQKSSLI